MKKQRVWNPNVTAAEVREVWKDNDHSYDYLNVEVRKVDENTVTVKAERMYEYLPLEYKHLSRMADLFGTTRINEDRYDSSGCETCDYGSQYTLNFTITKEL